MLAILESSFSLLLLVAQLAPKSSNTITRNESTHRYIYPVHLYWWLTNKSGEPVTVLKKISALGVLLSFVFNINLSGIQLLHYIDLFLFLD